jgi:hypothetical protein
MKKVQIANRGSNGELTMMDEVDLWSIQSMIESKTGSSGRPYVAGEDPNILLDHVVQTVPTRCVQEHRFNVFSVDHGVPDLFTLMGYSQPVICYHVGYVGKFIKFRNYIMEDPDKRRINDYGIGNLFELVSALYMQAGNCAFATTCLLQSIIETPSRTTDKEMYDHSNYQLHSSFYERHSIDEASFTVLYFGVTHEIGHTYGDECLRTATKIHSREITDEAITQAVVESAKRAFKEWASGTGYMFNCWHESYQVASKDKGSLLHCDNLRSEILADNLGFNILVTSLDSAARYRNHKPNFKIIAAEVIIGLFVVQLLEACKYLVKALPGEQSNPELLSRYFPISVNDMPLRAKLNAHQTIQDFQIAHAVRWEYLKPSLASLAMMHMFPDTWTVNGSSLVATCSSSELTRREAIAVSNVEGYLAYYTKEMLKLQARLEDVVDFVGHMATGKASEHRSRQPIDVTFADQIAGNFQTHLARLNGKAGGERKREILAQLAEYRTLLRRRGKQGDLEQIERILHRLESDLNNREK